MSRIGFSSNIRRRSRDVRQTREKKVYTTAQPKIGRIKFATKSPIKDAKAVPIKSKEYTFEPNL